MTVRQKLQILLARIYEPGVKPADQGDPPAEDIADEDREELTDDDGL